MTDVDKKVAKMKQKSDEVRSVFNLPDTEPVIQDYSCSYNHKPGRMYITANFCLWLPSIGSEGLQLAFLKFKNLKKDKNAMFFDNAITIEDEEGRTHFFATFNHRDETINLLHYLWKNPPSYIELEEEDLYPARSNNNPSSNNGNSTFGRGNNNNNSTATPYHDEDSWSRGANSNHGGQQMTTTVKVDTESSKNALRLASQARDMGTATLAELTLQAEQIDRIENNVEKIHSELDKSNKLLKGIESLPGAFANAMSKDVKGHQSEYRDRTLEIKYKEQVVDYDVLEKLPNDHLQPSILRFVEDKFMVVDPVKKTATNKDQIWNYDKIEEVVIRARHQHLDFRFHGKNNRFRICTSYLQAIVNEIVLRAKPHQIRVVFEPGTRKFSYGDPSLCKVPIKNRKDIHSVSNGFSRRANPTSATAKLFKDAPQEVQKGIQQQEQDLDDISNILTDITAIAETMGGELDRQTEQLDRVTGRVDSANEKLYQTNKRIDRLL